MRSVIHNEDVPVAPDDFSQGFAVDNLIFTAGQVPMTNKGEVLLDESVGEQTRVCLENMQGILEEAGASMDDVVKTTVYLDDIDDFDEMHGVYQEFFTGDMPARSVVEVATVLKGAAVKIEAIAVRD
jgi:reactive intermediate/imine deaminase